MAERPTLGCAHEAAGYRGIEAAAGARALAPEERERPDLFILDISMPDAAGVEICRAIKNDPLTHLTSVIQISGGAVAA